MKFNELHVKNTEDRGWHTLYRAQGSCCWCFSSLLTRLFLNCSLVANRAWDLEPRRWWAQNRHCKWAPSGASSAKPYYEDVRWIPCSLSSCRWVWDTLRSRETLLSAWWSVRMGEPLAYKPLAIKRQVTLGRSMRLDLEFWPYRSPALGSHATHFYFRAWSPSPPSESEIKISSFRICVGNK